MRRVSFLLTCLACVSYGRRVQISTAPKHPSPGASFPSSLRFRVSDPKTSKERQQWQTISHGSSLLQRSGVHQLLQLRGGDGPATRLTREEVLEKLNQVPAFAIVDGAERIIPIPNESGGQEICWFIDPLEAQDLLELTIKANPNAKGVHLAVSPLGHAVELCGGFPETQGQADFKGGVLKICGSRKLVEPAVSILNEQLTANGLKPGEWVLPIFCSEEFQTDSLMPLFFSPIDFELAWAQTNGEDTEAPENLAVVDLRLLVNQMMNTDAFNWKAAQFVSSRKAVDLAHEVQSAAKQLASEFKARAAHDVDGHSNEDPS